jgi:hypothetical protein
VPSYILLWPTRGLRLPGLAAGVVIGVVYFLRIIRIIRRRMPRVDLKMRIAAVSWTQMPKFPIVDSSRSPQGYGSCEEPPSTNLSVLRFHQVRYSGL